SFGAPRRDRARPARAHRRGAPRRRGDGGGLLRRQRPVDAGARRGARRGAVRGRRAGADGDRLSAGDGEESGGRPRARDEGTDRLPGAGAPVAAPHARARRRRWAGDRHLPRAKHAGPATRRAMIAFLRGKLLEADGEAAVIDVAGVGYQVLVSASTATALSLGGGSETQLYVHTHFVKDEPLRLYGFAEMTERTLFQTLISVQGVGPRVALAILAGIEARELVRAIATGDIGRLTEGKGVAMVPVPARGEAPQGPLGDVYGALVQLGYKPGEIEPLLERLDPARPVADLVREALGALRRQ